MRNFVKRLIFNLIEANKNKLESESFFKVFINFSKNLPIELKQLVEKKDKKNIKTLITQFFIDDLTVLKKAL
jgi:DNA polymerase/3'-5' exonuclease PolX